LLEDDMPGPDAEQWQATTGRLRGLRAAGTLTTAHVRLAAAGLGVTERTVWRRISDSRADDQPRHRGPAAYQVSAADLEAFAYFRANVAAVHRARAAVVDGPGAAAGGPVPRFLAEGWAEARPVSLRTLQEAFGRELTPAARAALAEGEHARRSHEVYLRRAAVPRNQVWELDHKELPVLVLPPRGPVRKPWLTSVVDAGTRALVGYAIALYPSAGTVLTALRMALVHDPDRGPFGAVPAVARVDRGLEFAASPVTGALDALCVACDRLYPFQPHQKGTVERIHLTIEQTLLTTLPGYTKGPRDAAGRLYGPVKDDARSRDTAGNARTGPWRIERFCQRFAGWVRWYNAERPHNGLDGRTPLQAWEEDPTPLQRIAAENVRHLLLAGEERIIGKDGIRLHGLAYVAPELQGRRGQKVQVRFMPHDDRFIEVYLGAGHLCTAHPQGHLSPEQAEEFRAHARAEARQLAAQRRRAAARARTELAPLTGAGPAEDSRLVPAAAGPPTAARHRDDRLRRAARPDLLGLRPPAALPPADGQEA
jgi:putative transposase